MGVNGIYGLSGSGLDIESLVKVGMMGKKKQLEKMQQTYTKNEWKKETFLDVYDKINDYNLSTLSPYTKSASTNPRSATSSNPLITATASSSSPVMNHTITIEQTATNAYFVGTKRITETDTDGKEVYAKGTSSLGTAVSFYLGDSSNTGVTSATKAYASITGTSDFLSSDADTFSAFLQDAYDDAVEEEGSGATDVVFQISLNDGTKSDLVEITYGDIDEFLKEGNTTAGGFAEFLEGKIQTANIAVSYEASTQSLKFENREASPTATVDVDFEAIDGTLGNKILQSLGGDAGDDGNCSLTISSSDTTTGASGTLAGFNTAKGVNISLSAGDTYYDLVSKINNAGTNIRANFDDVQHKLSIYNLKTGSENTVTITTDAGDTATADFLTNLGLKDAHGKSSPLTFTAGQVYSTQGNDASVIIDGDTYTDITSNSLNVNGVRYDFGNITEKTTAVVSVSQDVETIVDNVKSFVEDYNKLMKELNDMYREKPNSSYAPLTESQKAEMTEEQIKKWEEKAKAGMLYHDSTLRKIISEMRTAISGQVASVPSNSKYKTMYSIGISSKGLEGQIQLDEDKLRDALTADPDSVYNVISSSEKINGKIVGKNSGVAHRLYDTLNDTALKSIKNVAGTSKDTSDDSQLSTLLRSLQTRMSSFQSMMNSFEDSLYKKYDAMESALAMLGSQLNYVTGMFAQ